jgi:hypothetical protein
MSLKALILGCVITTIIFLSGQLVYILLASYIGSASVNYELIGEYKELLWFCFSMGTYAICFVLGGLFTSLLTDEKKIIHAGLVGFLVAGGSILISADLADLNYKAIILLAVGLCFAAWGGKIGFEPKRTLDDVH